MSRKSNKRAARAFELVAHAIDETAASRPGLNLEAARAGLKDLLALAQVRARLRSGKSGAAPSGSTGARAVPAVAALGPRIRWCAMSGARAEKDRAFAADILGPDVWPGRRRRKTGDKIGVALGGERDALLLMERLVAEPEMAGDERDLVRTLKRLNRRRAKLARRADALSEKMRRAR